MPRIPMGISFSSSPVHGKIIADLFIVPDCRICRHKPWRDGKTEQAEVRQIFYYAVSVFPFAEGRGFREKGQRESRKCSDRGHCVT